MKSQPKQRRLFVKALLPIAGWFVLSAIIGVCFVRLDKRFAATGNFWYPYGIVEAFEKWPGILSGILGTIAIAITIYVLQSGIQESFNLTIESLQKALSNFDEIQRTALELLQFSGMDVGAKFFMIAASPVFGIELPEHERREWEKLLRERIFSHCKVQILVFDWLCPDGSMESYLGRFCRSLETYSRDKKKIGHTTAVKLLTRCWRLLATFIPLRTERSNFDIRRINDPPFGIILSSGAAGSKALFYFESGMSLESGVPTIGFATIDQHWIGLAERAFVTAFERAAKIEDRRSDAEKRRDEALITRFEETDSVRKVSVEGYEIETDTDVFPPDIGLGVSLLIKSLKTAGTFLKQEMPYGAKLVGIDVGSGSGILSLVLAEFCEIVYATETWQPAIANTEKTLKNVNVSTKIRRGDLLADIQEKSGQNRILIAFNHPYYPSPFNLYNTGPPDSGTEMINRFFDQVVEKLPDTTYILMPFSNVASEHGPRRVAEQRGFRVQMTAFSADGSDRIFLITKDQNSGLLQPALWSPVPTK